MQRSFENHATGSPVPRIQADPRAWGPPSWRPRGAPSIPRDPCGQARSDRGRPCSLWAPRRAVLAVIAIAGGGGWGQSRSCTVKSRRGRAELPLDTGLPTRVRRGSRERWADTGRRPEIFCPGEATSLACARVRAREMSKRCGRISGLGPGRGAVAREYARRHLALRNYRQNATTGRTCSTSASPRLTSPTAAPTDCSTP
jgi:hypothetical protein